MLRPAGSPTSALRRRLARSLTRGCGRGGGSPMRRSRESVARVRAWVLALVCTLSWGALAVPAKAVPSDLCSLLSPGQIGKARPAVPHAENTSGSASISQHRGGNGMRLPVSTADRHGRPAQGCLHYVCGVVAGRGQGRLCPYAALRGELRTHHPGGRARRRRISGRQLRPPRAQRNGALLHQLHPDGHVHVEGRPAGEDTGRVGGGTTVVEGGTA